MRRPVCICGGGRQSWLDPFGLVRFGWGVLAVAAATGCVVDAVVIEADHVGFAFDETAVGAVETGKGGGGQTDGENAYHGGASW